MSRPDQEHRPSTLGPFAFGLKMAIARGLPVIAILAASLILGAADFGRLATLIVGLTVATLLADSGTDAAATWLVSRRASGVARDRGLGALTWTRTSISLGATIALAVPSIFALPGSPVVLVISVILAVSGNVVAAFNGSTRIALRVSERGESRAFLQEKTVLSSCFLGLLIVVPANLGSIALAFLVANAIGPVVAAYANYRQAGATAWRTSRAEVTALLRQSAPFAATTALTTVVWRISTLLLAVSGAHAAVGYLTLAYYPILAVSTIPIASAPLLLLKSRSERSQHGRAIGFAARAGLATGFAVGSAALLANWLVPPDLVADDVWPTMVVLSAALPFLWLNPILVSAVRTHKGLWIATVPHLIAALGAGLLALVLLPASGAVGAAVVVVAAEAIAFGVLVLLWRAARA